ncbi:hypothetical protein BOTBODRAFT_502947 [Botryobasidium botryosum FD-172 SS1]|uniref:Uncharacterized protein n=1 Tax=Botryobasidium botryosum (strain FD-172 SS1) TaxID=930990 RepID=A0A067M348_BOTB1|nr:hypothetical protein BOTBODRAFT_502947 [Botryobasidium botryosum FD-172 SS1]
MSGALVGATVMEAQAQVAARHRLFLCNSVAWPVSFKLTFKFDDTTLTRVTLIRFSLTRISLPDIFSCLSLSLGRGAGISLNLARWIGRGRGSS